MDCVKFGKTTPLDEIRSDGIDLEEKDGKTTLRVYPVLNNPWNFIKKDPTMDCMLWKTFMCERIVKQVCPSRNALYHLIVLIATRWWLNQRHIRTYWNSKQR